MSKFFKVNVSVIIFNEDRNILLQKRSADEEVFPGKWGIPGGTVEMSDQSLESALSREVLEEVGVEIRNIEFLQNNIRPKELYGMVYVVCTAEYKSGNPVAMDGTELVQWTPVTEAVNFDLTPTTREAIVLAYERKNSTRSI